MAPSHFPGGARPVAPAEPSTHALDVPGAVLATAAHGGVEIRPIAAPG